MGIFSTVLIVCLITGILAFVLSLANKTIANYGQKKITINGDKEIEIEGGNSLLSSLVEKEIFIPSACGGKGSCGYCKVKVTEGGGPLLATETGFVSPSEAKEGIRLSCQVKVKDDIKIQIPEELFNVKQYNYTVESIVSVTDKIKHLRLKLPQDKEINFKPGQYIQILAPIYEESDEEVYRAYSLASSNAEKGLIELLIGLVPGGKCSTYVHKYLKEGDKITIVGPFGDFYYQESQREMVMASIGTGMAPILSILRYMKANNITHRKATFYCGARAKSDLFMLDELKDITDTLPNVKVIYTLSKPDEHDNWEGDLGRVTDSISKYMGDGSDKEAYLCGSTVMIDSVVKLLKSMNMPEDKIYYDKFE
jgi:Na+-transporting NADH:ubiquinone oxidoreductase subunit F